MAFSISWLIAVWMGKQSPSIEAKVPVRRKGVDQIVQLLKIVTLRPLFFASGMEGRVKRRSLRLNEIYQLVVEGTRAKIC